MALSRSTSHNAPRHVHAKPIATPHIPYAIRSKTEQGHGNGARAREHGDRRCGRRLPQCSKEGGRGMGRRRGEGRGGGRGRGGRGQEERGKVRDGIGGRNPRVPDISGPITPSIIQCCKILSFFSHSKILKFLTPPFLVKSRALAVRSVESLQEGEDRPPVAVISSTGSPTL